ncbi:MAG: NlpC/P60 family protein [Actinomycetes bacterium]
MTANKAKSGVVAVTAALACALCAAVLLLSAAASAAPRAKDIQELQREAARAQADVKRLDRRAEIAIEKYNVARADLDALNARLIATRMDLQRAQLQLDVARAVLGDRMTDMYKNGDVSLLDVIIGMHDLTDIETSIDYFNQINRADANTVTGIEDLARRVGDLEKSIEKDRETALAKEIVLRNQQTDVEDQLAQRKALLADLSGQVRQLLEQQARLDAAASARLASAAGVDISTINGTAAQVALVKETMKYLGIPYVWAGATPAGGFDCSGLVLYVYAKFGVGFPHAATMQARMGTPVPFDQLQPADLVFFGTPSFYHHVGIYIGNGLFIEAPHTGDVVKVSQLAGRGASLFCRYPIRL